MSYSATVAYEHKRYYQWHLRILPRLVTPAGFELGTGISVNPAHLETAAAVLFEATPEPFVPTTAA